VKAMGGGGGKTIKALAGQNQSEGERWKAGGKGREAPGGTAGDRALYGDQGPAGGPYVVACPLPPVPPFYQAAKTTR
jgi:hypothetical protein